MYQQYQPYLPQVTNNNLPTISLSPRNFNETSPRNLTEISSPRPITNLPTVNISTPQRFPNIILPSLPNVSSVQNRNLPSVQANTLPGFPSVQSNILPGFPSVQANTLPTLNLSSFPSVQTNTLPTLNLSTLPSVNVSSTNYNLPSLNVSSFPTTNLPTLPSVTLSSTNYNLPTLPTLNTDFSFGFPNILGSFIPSLLADNEKAELGWTRENPPDNRYKRIGCIGDGSCFFHALSKGISGIYQATYQKSSEVLEENLRKFEVSINNPNLFNPYMFNPIRNVNNPQVKYTIIDQFSFEGSMQSFRSTFIRLLRRDLADQLLNNQKLRDIVGTVLINEIEAQGQIISYENPNLNELQASEVAYNYVINDLIQELRSLDSVDARYANILGEYYGVDIYVIIDREMQNTNSTREILSEWYNFAVKGPRNMRINGDQTPSKPSVVLIHVNGGHFEIVGNVDPITSYIQTNFLSDDPFIRQLFGLLLEKRSGGSES